MAILRDLWMAKSNEDEEVKVKTAYQYVVDLKERMEIYL